MRAEVGHKRAGAIRHLGGGWFCARQAKCFDCLGRRALENTSKCSLVPNSASDPASPSAAPFPPPPYSSPAERTTTAHCLCAPARTRRKRTDRTQIPLLRSVSKSVAANHFGKSPASCFPRQIVDEQQLSRNRRGSPFGAKSSTITKAARFGR